MGLFDRIFGTPKAAFISMNEHPDNTKLIGLLEIYGKNRSQENYQKAFHEIVVGNSLLIVPSINDGKLKHTWETLEKNSTIKLTSVYDQDGLKVLGVFTTPEKLVEWTKKETEYTAMKSKDAIDFCQANGIDRIVIDTDFSTMLVLERSREHISTETIQKETQVQVGAPSNPISGKHLEKFQSNFSKVSVIKEVYHYAMLRNNESILMLGFVLDIYSEDSRAACINAVQNAMKGEKLELPLEMLMLNDEGWCQTVKGIKNSLIYKI